MRRPSSVLNSYLIPTPGRADSSIRGTSHLLERATLLRRLAWVARALRHPPQPDRFYLATPNPKGGDLAAPDDQMDPIGIPGHRHVGHRRHGLAGWVGVEHPRDLPTLALGVPHRSEVLMRVHGEAHW